jgi:two-component system, OmpR family, phosphate regulon sensor histidine kinase PhoR
MQKKTIWILTIILSVTLIGLILVQLYWIKNAIKIKEEQFSQLVNKGIGNIIDEIEKSEMVYQVVDEIDPYKSITPSGKSALNYHYKKLNQSLFSVSTTNHEKEIFIIQPSDSIKKITQLQQFLGDGFLFNNKENLLLNKSNKKKLFKNLNPSSDFVEKLTEKKVFVENVVNKLVQIDMEIKDRISKETIEEIIKKSFNSIDENLDYEYSVVKNGLTIVYKSDNFDPKTNAKIYTGQLFPKDIFSRDNFLVIYFPDQRSYILKSTGFIAFTSIILTLIIILGFSLSIHVMFKQKRISQIKNDFVNNMTHELKTPISTISLASQLLKDKSVPMEHKNIDYISGIIDDESKRLSYQVEKVLKTALFEQGQIKLRLRQLDIHELIDNVVHNFEIQVKNRNGSIEKNLEATRSIVNIDEVHFTNIIFNLLDNAVKYSKDEPEILIATSDNNTGIYISVSDKGIGIKKQDQKKIFDQFYRVPTGNLHDVKGFGLGLNYVKKMVEEHGGQITLESELKKGTTFKIFIPTNNTNDGRS